MVKVERLIDPSLLVEVEAGARSSNDVGTVVARRHQLLSVRSMASVGPRGLEWYLLDTRQGHAMVTATAL